MERIDRYMDVVPLPVLLFLPVLGVIAMLLTPSRARLPLSLALMVLWLALGRLPGLGMVHAVCKTGGIAAFGIVALAAFMTPRPHAPVARIAWLYPIISVFSILFVITTVDRTVALVTRAQWFMLMIAVIGVVRTVTDEASLLRILRWMAIGSAIAMLVIFAALALNPLTAFRAGIGRFEPWGANANQIGVDFSLAAPLMLYFSLRATNTLSRSVWLGFFGLAAGLALLTASRSILITVIAPAIPMLWSMRKRPFFVISAAVVGGAVFVALIADAVGSANVQRLTSLETGRVEIFQEYWKIVGQRPLVGLLGTQGESFAADPSVGAHPHNAYLEMLYVGGIAYLLPFLLLMIATTLATFRVWTKRFSLGVDPLLVSTLACFMAIIYAHGFVNGTINYPTYSWAFLHVLVSVLFLSWARRMSEGSLFGADGDDAFDEDQEQWGYDADGYAEDSPDSA